MLTVEVVTEEMVVLVVVVVVFMVAVVVVIEEMVASEAEIKVLDYWYSGFGSIGVIVMLVVPVAEWCW